MHRPALILALTCATAAPASAQKIARLTEELRLDATREDFPSVRQVAVGPRGQIVVGIGTENTIRIYDAAGRKLGAVGRVGSGPGEFRSIGGIGWIADTMWVDDYQLRRFSYFGPDLKLLRTVPRSKPQLSGEVIPEGNSRGLYFNPYVLYPDGSTFGDGSRATSTQRAQPWVRFVGFQSPTGQITPVKAQPKFEDDRSRLFYAGFSNYVPFTVSPTIAWTPDGSRYGFMTVENGKDGGTIRITAYGRDGTQELDRSIPFKGVPIPASVRDSALDAFIPPGGRVLEGPPEMPRRFQEMARTRMPSFYPPVESMSFGSDRTIWLFRPTQNDQWVVDVFDERGNALGTVQPPKKGRVRFGTRTHVYVTQRDEDDLISVVRYRISWP